MLHLILATTLLSSTAFAGSVSARPTCTMNHQPEKSLTSLTTILDGEARMALDDSIQYLGRALQAQQNSTWKKMLQRAKSTRIVNASAGQCRDVVAFVYIGSYTVYVCDSFYDYFSSYRTQIMLHELAHVAGISDECRADSIAKDILNASGGSVYPGGYDDECGASQNQTAFNNDWRN